MNSQKVIQIVKRLGIVFALLIALVMIISAVEKKETAHIAATRISIAPLPDGNFLIDSTDVVKTIERAFGYKLNHKKIGRINIERVERVLENEPFVLNAEVHVDAKNVVHISLSQRQPVLRIIDAESKNYYFDDEGQVLPLSVHHTARVLVATGDIPPHVPDFLVREKHLLKDLFYLTQYIRTDPFWLSMIEQIEVKDNEFYLVPKVGKQIIRFGTYAGMTKKFRRLRIFYEEVMTREGFAKYREIDARFDHQVVGVK